MSYLYNENVFWGALAKQDLDTVFVMLDSNTLQAIDGNLTVLTTLPLAGSLCNVAVS